MLQRNETNRKLSATTIIQSPRGSPNYDRPCRFACGPCESHSCQSWQLQVMHCTAKSMQQPEVNNRINLSRLQHRGVCLHCRGLLLSPPRGCPESQPALQRAQFELGNHAHPAHCTSRTVIETQASGASIIAAEGAVGIHCDSSVAESANPGSNRLSSQSGATGGSPCDAGSCPGAES